MIIDIRINVWQPWFTSWRVRSKEKQTKKRAFEADNTTDLSKDVKKFRLMTYSGHCFLLDSFLILAAALVVCIEVLSTVFRYTNAYLPDIYPAGTKYSYGSCYIIAWVIFFQLLFSSFVFFACSKKRKGTFDEATEEEALANRPVDLTRSFRSWITIPSFFMIEWSKLNLDQSILL